MSQGNNAEFETIKILTKQIANLTEHMAKVSMVSSSASANNAANLCDTCGVPGHCSSTRRRMPCIVNLLATHMLTDIMQVLSILICPTQARMC